MNDTISPNYADARQGERRAAGSAGVPPAGSGVPPEPSERTTGALLARVGISDVRVCQAGRPRYPRHAVPFVARRWISNPNFILFLRRRVGAVAGVMLLLFTGLGGPLPAAAAAPPPRVEPAELNDSLDRVLQRREYTWRLPRQAAAQADENKGWLATFFEEAWNKLARTVRKALKWIEDAFEWLRKFFQRNPLDDGSEASSGKVDWPTAARWTLIALVAVLLGILGVLLLRWRKARGAGIVTARPVAAVPDLNEEGVTADQLPEDGWLRLAQELVARGDLRLALRASYLAGLAHLGHRELIRIARHKSNYDYERELRRRARGNDSLLDAFDENLTSFERSWYGEHEVTPGTIGSFSENLERIRAC